MIELTEPSWSELTHAYGNASDIPELLRQLAQNPAPMRENDSEPWFTLWSSLCHQGDVYQASYAAIPHIVAIAKSSTGLLDFGFFQLPAAVEIARNNEQGPEISPALSDAYFEAISELRNEVAKRVDQAWDRPTLLSALSAIAISKGDHKVAEAILSFDDDIISKVIDLKF